MSEPTLQANFSANTAGFSQGVSVLQQKLNELNTAMEQTKQAVKNTNSEIRTYQKELTQLKNATNNGTVATDEQKQRMQELRDKIAQTTSQLGTMRTAQQDLQSQIKNVNEELKNGANNAASFGDVLKASLCSAAVQQAVSKLASSLKSAAQYCYNVGSSFEAGMSQVSAISGATAAEMEQLTQRAKELGAATKFTASEAAEAMNYMAMAGWDAEQMLGGIDGVISLAAASGENLGQVSDIVTDALTAFGLAAEDAGHFSDVLAAASAASNTNVAMMGETFKYAAPLAGALGFSIEEVSEAVGLMANSGIKSSQAGTTLRTFFTALSDDVKITGDAIGEVTIKTSNADGTMRSLNEILTDMRAAFAQLSEAEQTAQAEAVAGKEAMSGLLALMNAGEADVEKLRAAIVDCDSAAQSMAETMQDNVSGAVTIMQSALEGLGIAVYEKFGDELKDNISDITDIFSNLTEKIDGGAYDEVFEHLANSVGNAAEQLINLAATALPGIIEGLASLITIVVEGRNVIAGLVTTFIAWKGTMAVATTITKVVNAVKALKTGLVAAKTATEAATVAQNALNASLITNPWVTLGVAIAAVAAGIAVFAVTSYDASQSVEELRNKAEELNQTAHESKSAADDVADLVEEYKHIKETADDTEEAKAKLKEIQDKLIDTYDLEADGIDLVNGKYEEQLGLLEQLSAEKSESAKLDAKAAYASYLSAEEKEAKTENVYADQWDNLPTFLEETISNIPNVEYYGALTHARHGQYKADSGYKFSISGNTEEKLTAYEQLLNAFSVEQAAENPELYSQIYTAYKELSAQNETNKQILDTYDYYFGDNNTQGAESAYPVYHAGDTPPNQNPNWYADEQAAKHAAHEAERNANLLAYKNEKTGVDWSDYNSIKKYYQYLKDTDEISAEEYYNQLEKYANELLDEKSDEWRSATAEIYKGRKSISGSASTSSSASGNDLENQYDSEKEYLKWRLDMGYITEAEYYAQLAALRDKYLDESSSKWRSATLDIHKYQVSQNGSALDEIKEQYNDAISAIDDEIKQHNRDREDEDIESKIAEVDKQLQYDRLDEYSRMQLEQKRQELLDEKEETEWQRQKSDEKEMLSTVYTMAKDAYDQGVADLNSALQVASAVFSAIGTGAQQTANTVSTVNNNSVSMIMNAVSQTSDQIAAAVIKALSSSI